MDVVHLTALHHPGFLHHRSGIEGGELKPLEDIQPPIDGDLPAVVCGDAAGVEMGAGVDLSAEWGAGAGEEILHLAEVT